MPFSVKSSVAEAETRAASSDLGLERPAGAGGDRLVQHEPAWVALLGLGGFGQFLVGAVRHRRAIRLLV